MVAQTRGYADNAHVVMSFGVRQRRPLSLGVECLGQSLKTHGMIKLEFGTGACELLHVLEDADILSCFFLQLPQLQIAYRGMGAHTSSQFQHRAQNVERRNRNDWKETQRKEEMRVYLLRKHRRSWRLLLFWPKTRSGAQLCTYAWMRVRQWVHRHMNTCVVVAQPSLDDTRDHGSQGKR